MERSLNIQTFGAVAVLIAFILSEAASWYLFACPSCSTAWYLNLGPFHIFEIARNGTSAARYLFTPNSLPIACVALVVVFAARLFSCRLLVAFAANLAFAFAAALADGAARARPNASLNLLHSLAEQDFLLLFGFLLVAAFVSCLASHVSFIAAIRVETDERRGFTGHLARFDRPR